MRMAISKRQSERLAKILISLSTEEAKKWKEALPPRKYAAGSVLFYRDHHPYGVYVIHSGHVDLFLDKRSKKPPHPAETNQSIGLPLFAMDEPYPASGVVGSEVLASFASRSLIQKWIRERNPLIPERFWDLEKAKH